MTLHPHRRPGIVGTKRSLLARRLVPAPSTESNGTGHLSRTLAKAMAHKHYWEGLPADLGMIVG